MDKRLVKLLQSGKIGGGNLYLLDTYNQAVHEDVSCTIRTNINTANHHFIFERMSDKVIGHSNTDKQYKFYQYPRGVNKGGVLNTEICPTISTSSWEHNCLLIELDANNQQFLKEMKEIKHIGRISSSQNSRVIDPEGISYAVTNGNKDGEPKIIEPIGCAMRGRNPENPSERGRSNGKYKQRIEMGSNISNTITTVQKDSLVAEPISEETAKTICLNSKVDGKQPSLEHRIYDCSGISTAITTEFHPNIAEPLRIPQATSKGYVEVEPGSLFDGSYPNSKTRRGRVQDNGQSSPTLTANGEPPYYYEGVSQLKHNMYEIEKRGISETNYKTNTGEILRLLRDKIGEKDYQWAIGRFRGILKEEILQSGLHEESICETRDKQSGIFSCTPHIQKDCVSDRRKGDDLREVRIDKKHRCASHRWELSEQFKREFDDIVSELSLKNSSSKIHLCDLWETFKSPQSLQLALFTMEEIWESFTQAVEYTKATEYRIRKLTPREVFRLMGVSETDIDKIQASGISNSQQYKMAGNSIVVDVLEHLLKNLFIDTDTTQIDNDRQMRLF